MRARMLPRLTSQNIKFLRSVQHLFEKHHENKQTCFHDARRWKASDEREEIMKTIPIAEQKRRRYS